jgi:oligoendopeptidase F
VHYKGGKRIPGVCNFTSNAVLDQVGAGSQAIHTLFHEAGHAADRLNSEQEDVCINTEYPPASVSWAETHSMFLDSVSSSIEWRDRYACNLKGESYPFSLFEKRIQKIQPLIPLGLMGIMSVVFFEKEVYECKNISRDFVLRAAKKTYRKYFDRSVDSISILNVPHIYNWESSAYYHGYGLAELAVHQWRDYFYKKYGYIVDNPRVGKEMNAVWKLGSLYTTKKFVTLATGKPPRADAYVRNVTRSLDEILKESQKRITRLRKVSRAKGPVKLNARIALFHGKKKIADNTKSFEVMEKKYRAWLKSVQ